METKVQAGLALDPTRIVATRDKGTYVSTSCKADTISCYITGSVLLPSNRLVIIDSYNDKIKMVDLATGKVISWLSLPADPWDITEVAGTESYLAVDKTILFISIDSFTDFSLGQEIKTSHRCFGIASTAEKLIVTLTTPEYFGWVEIIDHHGHVYQTISENEWGLRLFRDPHFVSVSRDGTLIYVSDRKRHKVICVRVRDSSVHAVYKDRELYNPRKVVMDSFGTLYILGQATDNLHLVTPDCDKIKVLIEKWNGLSNPSCVSLCEKTKTLYTYMVEWAVPVAVYKLSS